MTLQNIVLLLSGCGVGFDYTGHPSKDSDDLSDTADSSHDSSYDSALDTAFDDTASDDTGDSSSPDLAPEITSVTVTPNPVSNTETFTIEALVLDDHGVDFVTSTILGSPQQMSKIAPDTYSLTYTASDFSLGDIGYTITAYDTLSQQTTATGTFSVYDAVAPSLTCTATDGKNDGSQFIDILCLSADDNELASVSYVSSLASGELVTTGDSSYTASIDPTDFAAADYTIDITSIDVSGNSSLVTVTVSVTDETAPSLSCTTTNGANDGSASIDVVCTASDETALASSNPVTYTSSLGSDALVNTSGTTYETSLSVAGIVAGSYTFTVTATDTVGNSSSSALTPTVTDLTSPTVTSVYTDVSSVLNDGTESFIVYACFTDETDGTSLGGSVTATIDSLVQTLSYDSGSSCFISSVNGNNFSEGTYTIEVSGADAAGNAVSDSSASIEVTEPSSCPYTCASNICLYVDGALEAEVTTSFPSQMTSIDTIRLGHGSQYFDNVSLVVENVSYVSEDFSSSIGCFNTGSVSSGMYVTSGTDNDCAFSSAFDASTLEWMMSVDVIAGSSPNLSFRSSSASAPGVNWDFAASGYINDGAGNSVSFTSGTPDSSVDHTIVMCNYH